MPAFERTDVLPRSRDADVLAAFMRGVYGWMCGGLAVTAVTAWLVSSSPALTAAIFGTRMVFRVLAIVQLGIVFTLSARVDRMVSIGESVFTTFVVAAGMFGALAAYGTVTRRQLSGLGQFLFMGLIGLVIAPIVGLFWHNDGLQFVTSFIGVIVLESA